jgi:hypothetical protein
MTHAQPRGLVGYAITFGEAMIDRCRPLPFCRNARITHARGEAKSQLQIRVTRLHSRCLRAA